MTLALSACFPQKPVASDIVGTWVEERRSSMNPAAGPCATVEFKPNGTFVGRNIPQDYFLSDLPAARVDATGQWSLEVSTDPLAWDRINLRFEVTGGAGFGSRFGSRLNVASDGSERRLFVWKGDESNRITFVKRTVPVC